MILSSLKSFADSLFSESIKKFLTWVFGLGFVIWIIDQVKNYLITPTLFRPWLLILIAIGLIFIFPFYLIIRNKYKKEYKIDVRNKFYNDCEPSEYCKKTKWHFKRSNKFYFVPLLSRSYNTLDFVDLCGPYCFTCQHLLSLEKTIFNNPKFLCVKCTKRYTIPSEIRENYRKKIITYFKSEFDLGNLNQAD